MSLEHIDLTQGRRFDDNRINISTSSYINNRDIYSRLKKGQIPHKLKSNDEDEDLYNKAISWSAINVTDSTSNTVLYTLNSSTTWHTTTTAFNNSLLEEYRINNIWDNNSSIYYYTPYKSQSYNSEIYDKQLIHTRISKDPFETVIDNADVIHKLREYDYIGEYYNFHHKSIKNRMYEYDYDISCSNIINRLEDNGYDDKDDLQWYVNNFSRPSNIDLLKMRAPFIKRVYVTNGGISFDRKELDFDMVLAKEHFDESLAMSKI